MRLDGYEMTCDILKLARSFILKHQPPEILPAKRDFLAVIDGAEGAGKSSSGAKFCAEIDPGFTARYRFFYSTKELSAAFMAGYDKINKTLDFNNPAALKPGDAWVLDEGGESLYSRNWQNAEVRHLNQILMLSRFRGTIGFVVLPDFEILDNYVRRFRAGMLLRFESSYDVATGEMAYGIFEGYVGKQFASIRAQQKNGVVYAHYPSPSYYGLVPENTSEDWRAYQKVEPMRKMQLLAAHDKEINAPPKVPGKKGRPKKMEGKDDDDTAM